MLGNSEVGEANFRGGGRDLLLLIPYFLGDDDVEEVGGVFRDC